MFKALSTRSRALLISLFVTGLYVLFHIQLSVLEYLYQFDWGIFVLPGITFLIVFLGMFWVLNFSVKGERIITLNVFAALSIFIVFLFLEFLYMTGSALGKVQISVLTFIIVFIFNYNTILTVNILNTTYLEHIPLGQAGRAASYIISLIVEYFGFFLLFAKNMNVFLKTLLIFLMVLYYSYAIIWNLSISVVKRSISALAIAITIMLFSLVITLWPISTYLVSLILSIILYICLGIALEVREKLTKYVWGEYITLIILIIFILLFGSVWGINGPLI